MRFNLARRNQGLADLFIKEVLREFMVEYGIPDMKTAYKYVTGGTQGLAELVRYLNTLGYSAEMYYLPVNTDLLQELSIGSHEVSIDSPSFGWVIPDDDPFFVEFKLKHG